MIKIWTEENSKTFNNKIFNKAELEILNKINITSEMSIKETDKIITDYIVKKYKLKGLFEAEDIKLEDDDKKLLSLKDKIYDRLERIS